MTSPPKMQTEEHNHERNKQTVEPHSFCVVLTKLLQMSRRNKEQHIVICFFFFIQRLRPQVHLCSPRGDLEKRASGQVPHASSRYRASKASLSAFRFKQLFRSGYPSLHKDLDRLTILHMFLLLFILAGRKDEQKQSWLPLSPCGVALANMASV